MRKILILGGTGRLGGQVIRELAQDPQVSCVLGARDPARADGLARALGVEVRGVDVTRATSVNAALKDASVVVDAAGLFCWRDATVASACARLGVHYVDLAEHPRYLRTVTAMDARARESGACLRTGAGLVPGLAGALAAALFEQFDEHLVLLNIDSCWLGDAGPTALRSMLREVGQPVAGKPGECVGRRVAWAVFGPPLGRHALSRWTLSAAESWTETLKVPAISYRRAWGSGVSRLIGALAWARTHGLLRDLERFAPMARRLGERGTPGGALRLTAVGESGTARTIELTAQNPALLAVAPTLTLIRRFANESQWTPGAGLCADDLRLTEVIAALAGKSAQLLMH